MSRPMLALLILVFAPSCNEVFSGTAVYENGGTLCLTEDGELTTYGSATGNLPADTELTIHIKFDACMSGSCDTLTSATCSAVLDGTQVFVTSRAEVVTYGPSCTLDCNLVTTSCLTPPLPEGSYTFVHGEDEQVIVIPGETPECSVGY